MKIKKQMLAFLFVFLLLVTNTNVTNLLVGIKVEAKTITKPAINEAIEVGDNKDTIIDDLNESVVRTATDSEISPSEGKVELEVEPYTIKQLKVESDYDESLTYQWTNNYAEELSKGDSCLVWIGEWDERYTCKVTDLSGKESTIEYYIKVKQSNKSDWREQKVPFEQAATLSVNVDTADKSGIHYSWTRSDGTSIGKDKETCTTEQIQSYTEYNCEVSDGNSKQTITFTVGVQNYLSAAPHQDINQIRVPFGESTELIIDTFGLNTEGCSYTFRRREDDSVIQEGTKNTLQINNITKYQEIYCVVTDCYGNEVECSGTVFVDNKLKAKARNNNTYIEVPYGGSTTLEAECSALNEEGLTYEWQENYQTISGEVAPTLQLNNITKTCDYSMQVTDQYGLMKRVDFQVVVQNNLKAKAKDDETDFPITRGDSLTLEVIASATDMEGLTYEWCNTGTQEPFPETTEKLTLSNIQAGGVYQCTVTDRYANRQYITFNVYLGKLLNTVDNKFNYVEYVKKGDRPILKADVINVNKTGLSYKWIDSGTGRSLGENQSTLQADPVLKSRAYQCTITDGYNNVLKLFYDVEIENHFKCMPKDYRSQFKVMPSSDITLEVVATADDPTGITYQWFDEDYERINIQSENTLSLHSLTKSRQISCMVTDKYNTQKVVKFEVIIDNQFSLVASTDDTTIALPKEGEAVTLSVLATARNNQDITYQWYAQGTPVTGANTATYTTDPVTQAEDISCIATDSYGNVQQVGFVLYVDNAFNATSKEGRTISEIYLPYDGNTTLEVLTTANDEEGITYQWYEMGNDRKLVGETKSSLNVSNVTSSRSYYCVVKDKYKKKIRVDYKIYVQNHLSVDAQTQVIANADGSATLKVTATADNPDGLTYQWSNESVGSQIIRDANTSTLEISDVTSIQRYQCTVTDKYNTTVSKNFEVMVDNQFKLEAKDGKTDIKASPGDSIDLEVQASGKDTSGITYQWLNENGSYIVGENSTIYNLKNIKKTTSITCLATDCYGTESRILFVITIDNKLEATAKDEKTELYVPDGTTANLEVITNAEDKENITYTWYQIGFGETHIKLSETTNKLTTKKITSKCGYLCIVRDKYGNKKEIDFTVGVENGLTVKAKNDQPDLFADYKGSKTLEVVASADNKDDITYQWYEVNENNEEVKIDNANAASYVVGNITKMQTYHCEVIDKYNNVKVVNFTVSVENGLTIKPKNDQPELFVDYNGSTTLEVVVSAHNKEGITYQWYQEENGKVIKIDTAKSNSLLVENITKRQKYACRVTDKYNGKAETGFAVNIRDSSNSGSSVEEPTVTPTPNPGIPDLDKKTTLVSKIKVTGISKKITAGNKIALKATISPKKASKKSVKWTISNKKYAMVSSKGVVTTKQKGAGKWVTITATATDGSRSKGTYKIYITKGTIKKITLSGSKVAKAGKTIILKAKVTATKDANTKLIWKCSNTKYAKVTKNGKVTFSKNAKGKKVTIKAAATDGSGKKAMRKYKIK